MHVGRILSRRLAVTAAAVPPRSPAYARRRRLSGTPAPGGTSLLRMRIEQFTIIVDDYDKAIGFFTGALGFDLVEDSPSLTNDGRPKRWVVVRPPGAATGLLPAKADGRAQTRAVGDQFAGRAGFLLRVDDFDDAFRRMASA